MSRRKRFVERRLTFTRDDGDYRFLARLNRYNRARRRDIDSQVEAKQTISSVRENVSYTNVIDIDCAKSYVWKSEICTKNPRLWALARLCAFQDLCKSRSVWKHISHSNDTEALLWMPSRNNVTWKLIGLSNDSSKGNVGAARGSALIGTCYALRLRRAGWI